MEHAIRVEHVTKRFRIHSERNATLKEMLLYAGRARYKEFVALQDVCLDVPKGTTVGLLGMNGSGKSTLLKLISRILYPDSGSIQTFGRVSSLLELGAGFHPDFTGRENIYMNGSLLGLSKKELNYRMDDIIEFSELGDFVDQPVRSYSSGMYMRLAFSVAVAVDPEILLVDEILAVGDAPFQSKCMNRIRQLQSQNKTIVLVTHDTGAVERFCDLAVWLHNSRVVMEGEPTYCVQSYLDKMFTESANGQTIMSTDRNELTDTTHQRQPENDTEKVIEKSQHWGSKEVEFEDVSILSNLGPNVVRCGEALEIRTRFKCHKLLQNTTFGFSLCTEDGVRCYGTNTDIERVDVVKLEPGTAELIITIPSFILLSGTYFLDLAVHDVDGQPYDYWRRAANIQVISEKGDLGMCRIEHAWQFVFK